MGFRFHRSVRLIPGLRLNFNKSGTSLSVGGRGATVNFSKRGTKTTVGLPGTGLSWSETHKRSATGPAEASGAGLPSAGSGGRYTVPVAIAAVALLVLGLLTLSH